MAKLGRTRYLAARCHCLDVASLEAEDQFGRLDSTALGKAHGASFTAMLYLRLFGSDSFRFGCQRSLTARMALDLYGVDLIVPARDGHSSRPGARRGDNTGVFLDGADRAVNVGLGYLSTTRRHEHAHREMRMS